MHNTKGARKRLVKSGIAFICLLAVLVLVEVGSGRIDTLVNSLTQGLTSSFFDKFFFVFTFLFNNVTALILYLILFAFLFYKRRRDAWLLAAILLGGTIIGEIAKLLVQRFMPIPYLIAETGYSFPSMHAVYSTMFMLSLIFLFRDDIKNAMWRKIFVIVCIAVIVLVCLSRLYFSVHWTSDVIGGVLFGYAWFNLAVGIFQKIT